MWLERHAPGFSLFGVRNIHTPVALMHGDLNVLSVTRSSNLAEGQAGTGAKEFGQFLSLARGSVAELETQMLLSVEPGERNIALLNIVALARGLRIKPAKLPETIQ